MKEIKVSIFILLTVFIFSSGFGAVGQPEFSMPPLFSIDDVPNFAIFINRMINRNEVSGILPIDRKILNALKSCVNIPRTKFKSEDDTIMAYATFVGEIKNGWRVFNNSERPGYCFLVRSGGLPEMLLFSYLAEKLGIKGEDCAFSSNAIERVSHIIIELKSENLKNLRNFFKFNFID